MAFPSAKNWHQKVVKLASHWTHKSQNFQNIYFIFIIINYISSLVSVETEYVAEDLSKLLIMMTWTQNVAL